MKIDTDALKKQVVLHLPYLLFLLVFAKLGEAVRLAPGADASQKLLGLSEGFSLAFQSMWPGAALDWLVGLCGAVIVRLAVYLKGKDAKKYRKKVYAAVSNMSIAMERRDFLQQIDCFVCNQQEAGILFSDEYDHMGPEEMCRTLAANVGSARIPCMVVTMGDKGAVYACADGERGIVPAKKVNVIDTTGAGDAFFAGTVIGRAYGKTMAEACGIGSRLAASVICTAENVCPRFRPQEFGLDIPVVD